jgi:hypothetical protein
VTWLDEITLDTVIVHMTDDGPSLRGLKAAVYDDGLVLRDAVVLGENAMDVLDGEPFIPREKVLFMQLISP